MEILFLSFLWLFRFYGHRIFFDHKNGTTMEDFSNINSVGQQFCGRNFFSPTEMLSHRSEFRILSAFISESNP